MMPIITTLRGGSLTGCKALAAAATFFLLPLPACAQADEFQRWWQRTDGESLPLVNLVVDSAQLNGDGYIPGTVTIADRRRRTVAGQDMVSLSCRLKYRGMTSMRYPKKALAMKLVDAAGEKLDAPLLGMRSENNWILDGMYKDRLRMKNRVCFDVWNTMSRTPYQTKYQGRNGTEGRFVNLFVNGRYHGLYCLTDKVDRKLLGLKKYRTEGDGTSTLRGLLYKGYSNGLGHDLKQYDPSADTGGEHWNAWELKYPDDIPSAATWQPLREVMDFCGDATTDDDFAAAYQEWFYPENVADYVVFTLTLNILDNLWKNMFLSTPDIGQGHRWLITPWDMDGSLGAWYDGEYHPWRASIHRMDTIAPFDRLVARNVDGFNGRLVECWNRWKDTVLHPDSIFARLDRYAQSFMRDSTWQRETELWGSDSTAFLMKPMEEELAYTKGWYRKNYEYVSQLMTTLGIEPRGEAGRQVPADGRGAGIRLRLDGRPEGRSHGKGIYIDNGRKHLR